MPQCLEDFKRWWRRQGGGRFNWVYSARDLAHDAFMAGYQTALKRLQEEVKKQREEKDDGLAAN